MTQKREDKNKIAELKALLLTLDDRGLDSALLILRSLRFAESVIYTPKSVKQPQQPTEKRST